MCSFQSLKKLKNDVEDANNRVSHFIFGLMSRSGGGGDRLQMF